MEPPGTRSDVAPSIHSGEMTVPCGNFLFGDLGMVSAFRELLLGVTGGLVPQHGVSIAHAPTGERIVPMEYPGLHVHVNNHCAAVDDARMVPMEIPPLPIRTNNHCASVDDARMVPMEISPLLVCTNNHVATVELDVGEEISSHQNTTGCDVEDSECEEVIGNGQSVNLSVELSSRGLQSVDGDAALMCLSESSAELDCGSGTDGTDSVPKLHPDLSSEAVIQLKQCALGGCGCVLQQEMHPVETNEAFKKMLEITKTSRDYTCDKVLCNLYVSEDMCCNM